MAEWLKIFKRKSPEQAPVQKEHSRLQEEVEAFVKTMDANPNEIPAEMLASLKAMAGEADFAATINAAIEKLSEQYQAGSETLSQGHVPSADEYMAWRKENSNVLKDMVHMGSLKEELDAATSEEGLKNWGYERMAAKRLAINALKQLITQPE